MRGWAIAQARGGLGKSVNRAQREEARALAADRAMDVTEARKQPQEHRAAPEGDTGSTEVQCAFDQPGKVGVKPRAPKRWAKRGLSQAWQSLRKPFVTFFAWAPDRTH